MERLRKLLARSMIATSILAHGYWRAGSRLHNLYGAALVALVAIGTLPRIILKRVAFRKQIGSREDE